MAEEITKVQLEDKEGYPIAPFTLAESVYMANGKNAQEQIEYMDIDKIHAEGEIATTAIINATIEAVQAIETSGATYREGINTVSGEVKTLETYAFPLSIKCDVTPYFHLGLYKDKIKTEIYEYVGLKPTLTRVSISKVVNDSRSVILYNETYPPSDIEITNTIDGMKETYVVNAQTSTKSVSETATRYLCFYGVSTEEIITPSSVTGMTPVLTSDVSFNPTIETSYGEYIWLIIPNYLSINNVNISLHDFNNEDEYKDEKEKNPSIYFMQLDVNGLGTYKAYRSNKALDNEKWELDIC